MNITLVSRSIILLGMSLLVSTIQPGGTAQAHHSPAAFDTSRTQVVVGTVKEWRWGNPHTWLYLMVPNKDGVEEEWEIEGTSLVVLARAGWKASSLQPGDKVEVTLAPLRSGANGGSFSQIKRANGEVLKVNMGPPPGTP